MQCTILKILQYYLRSYIYDLQQLINGNKFLSSCLLLNTSPDMWSSEAAQVMNTNEHN